MNTHNLKLRLAKLELQAEQHEVSARAFRKQAAELTAELQTAARADEDNPPELLAAERALASNSLPLLRQRHQDLDCKRSNLNGPIMAADAAGDTATAERLRGYSSAWWPTVVAMRARIAELEAAAEERQKVVKEREARRKERADDEAECAAMRKLTMRMAADNKERNR